MIPDGICLEFQLACFEEALVLLEGCLRLCQTRQCAGSAGATAEDHRCGDSGTDAAAVDAARSPHGGLHAVPAGPERVQIDQSGPVDQLLALRTGGDASSMLALKSLK